MRPRGAHARGGRRGPAVGGQGTAVRGAASIAAAGTASRSAQAHGCARRLGWELRPHSAGLIPRHGPLTFFRPAKPSDSRKKKAKGISTNRQRLEKSEARFHRPAGATRDGAG